MGARRIVLLGPPGSGKGTQAKMIENACHIPHISTGDMLREAAAQESELGNRAKHFMEAGQLVPDELMVSIVEDRLGRPDSREGFILDGYPRTIEQARALDGYLRRQNVSLDTVLSIEVASVKVIERLSNRRICRRCGHVYNLITSPPGEEGRCEHCGGDLEQRGDDQPETVIERLKVYDDQTTNVKAYYAQTGLLQNVDGGRKVEEVYSEIASHLNCAGE